MWRIFLNVQGWGWEEAGGGDECKALEVGIPVTESSQLS